MHDKKVGISPEALRLFEAHEYPGNVRELKNFVLAAYNRCEGETIGLENLPLELLSKLSLHDDLIDINIKWTLKDIEKDHIVKALLKSKGNHQKAARRLGIHPKTLRRKVKGYRFKGKK